jgi:hypothetical protein
MPFRIYDMYHDRNRTHDPMQKLTSIRKRLTNQRSRVPFRGPPHLYSQSLRQQIVSSRGLTTPLHTFLALKKTSRRDTRPDPDPLSVAVSGSAPADAGRARSCPAASKRYLSQNQTRTSPSATGNDNSYTRKKGESRTGRRKEEQKKNKYER